MNNQLYREVIKKGKKEYIQLTSQESYLGYTLPTSTEWLSARGYLYKRKVYGEEH